MNSSTASWFFTSCIGTGWMTHVIRDCGHLRFSAFTTGITCTASPSALSITIAISRGGCARCSESDNERLAQLRAQARWKRGAELGFPLVQRAEEAASHRLRLGCAQRVADFCAIEIEHICAFPINQHVFEIEIM